MKCAHCNKKIVGQKTVVTTYNPRVEKTYHPECARKAKKRADSGLFSFSMNRWPGIG